MSECKNAYIDTETGLPVCALRSSFRPDGAGRYLDALKSVRECIPLQLRRRSSAEQCSGNPNTPKPIPPGR